MTTSNERCAVSYIYEINGTASQQSVIGPQPGEMADENYCLRWNDYEKKYAETFRVLREDEYFTDVTLATDGHSVKAHRVILSACSNYFHTILKSMSPWQHPVLLLQDVKPGDLSSLMDFIYFGQVNVNQEALPSFLKIAEKLKIKGLCETLAPAAPTHQIVQPPPPPTRKDVTTMIAAPSIVGQSVSHGANFEGLLPRSPYIQETTSTAIPTAALPQQLTRVAAVGGHPAPPAHQSPKSRPPGPPRPPPEPLMYVSPKRTKYSMSPQAISQSILRNQLQLKDLQQQQAAEHVEVKSEPMAILSTQEDVPSSGVNVTEFITTHDGDLATLSSLTGHGISPQFMFSPEPPETGGAPPAAAMVTIDDKTVRMEAVPVTTTTSAIHSHGQIQQHHQHQQHQPQPHHHNSNSSSTSNLDEPQDLTPAQDNSSVQTTPASSAQLSHQQPIHTPPTPTSIAVSSANNSMSGGNGASSPSTPTPPKKDRNTRKNCPYCHKDFHEMSLKRHIKDVHFRNQNTYVICPQCCKQYASQNSLYSHLNRVHGVKKDLIGEMQIQTVQAGSNTGPPGDNHHDGIMDLAHHSDSSN